MKMHLIFTIFLKMDFSKRAPQGFLIYGVILSITLPRMPELTELKCQPKSANSLIAQCLYYSYFKVMIETERLSIMDQQKQQKTQMLLGPGVASSGAPSLGPPPI